MLVHSVGFILGRPWSRAAVVGSATVAMAAMLSAPVYAAPAEQITCVYDAIDAGLKHRLAADLLLPPDAQRTANTGLEQESDAALQKAGAACATQHSWSEGERKMAEGYVMPNLLVVALRGDPALAKLDFDKLDAELLKPRANYAATELTDADMKILDKALTKAGLRSDGPEVVKGSIYISMLLMAQVTKAAFAAGVSPS